MPAQTTTGLKQELCQGCYRITIALGEGGMAVVHLACNLLLDRDVVSSECFHKPAVAACPTEGS